jgi:rRNA maturation endonuclease Nob1
MAPVIGHPGFLYAIAAVVAGLMMLRAGLSKRGLAMRHTSRRCPSCDRHFTGRLCPTCGSR